MNTRLKMLFNSLTKLKYIWGLVYKVLDYKSYKLVTVGLDSSTNNLTRRWYCT